MNYEIAVIFSFSLAIPAIIGWIRFNHINPTYYPFLYCMWIGVLNEIIGEIITRHGYSNAVNNNLYVLIESLLLTWQFKKWNLFDRTKYLFEILSAGFVVLWLIECFFMKKIGYTISYFRIIYSFIIVLMSCNILNRQLAPEHKNLLRNSSFLICIMFIIYYTYKVITGIFWLYGLHLSENFIMDITAILIYINLISNLVFAFAILWMPGKHRFSLPS